VQTPCSAALDAVLCRALQLAKAIAWADCAFVDALALSLEKPMSIQLNCQDPHRRGTRALPLLLLGALLLQALVGCGGGGSQSAMAVTIGIDMESTTEARRWKDTKMPMRHGEKVLASRGAMARAGKSQGPA